MLFVLSGSLYWQIDNPLQLPVHVLALPVDHQVPLVGALIVPYLLFYPYLIVTILYTAWLAPRVFQILMWAGILAFNFANILYLLYPTAVFRSAVLSEQTLWAPLINWMHTLFPPGNAFPSEHTMGACLLGATWVLIRNRWTPWALLLSGAIVAATLGLHQHFVLDLLSGATISLLCFLAAAGAVAFVRLQPMQVSFAQQEQETVILLS